LLGEVGVEGPEHLLLVHVLLLHILPETFGVRVHQMHGLVVYALISHVLVVVVVHGALVDVVGHKALALGKLPQHIPVLTQVIPHVI